MTEHCHPTLKLVDGKWVPFDGTEIGKVLPDGSIENTPYVYGEKSGRTIRGGRAISTYGSLEKIDEGHLRNPANGDVLTKSRSGKGFFSKMTGVFTKVYYSSEDNDE